MFYENVSEEFSGEEVSPVSCESSEDPADSLIIFFNVIRVLYYTAILLSGTALNILAIVLITRFKQLNTPPFYNALQIVCCDLIHALFIPVLILSSVIAGHWIFGEHICAGSGFLLNVIGLVRTFLLTALATDRFISPYYYPKIVKKFNTTAAVISWLVALATSLFVLVSDCYAYKKIAKHCFILDCDHCTAYSVTVWFGLVAPAGVIPLFLYSCLYHKAKKIQQMLSTDNRPTHNHKATITFFLMFISNFFVVFPFSLLTASVTALTESATVEYVFITSSGFITHFMIVVDPLYVLRNEDAKMALKNMFSDISKRLKSRNARSSGSM